MEKQKEKYEIPEEAGDILVLSPHCRDDAPVVGPVLNNIAVRRVAAVPVLAQHIAHHSQELVGVVWQRQHQPL